MWKCERDVKPFMGSLRLLLFLTAGLSVSVSNGAALQRFKFPIIDSGFPAVDRDQRPFWLENDRVLFYGIDVAKARPILEKWSDIEANRLGIGPEGFFSGFYVWNLRTGTIEPYQTGIARLCIEDGIVSFIRLRKAEDEVATVWRGPLGRETKLPVSAGEVLTQGPLFEYPCIWEERLGRASVRPLREGFGTLVYGIATPEDRNSPVMFVPASGAKAVSLPIKRSEFNPGFVRYIPWEGRYLIQESVRASSTQARAWYLEKDGKTPFPRIPTSGLTNVNYFPIKRGVLVTALPALKDRRGYGTATTYLLKGDGLEEVGPVIGLPSVSPDGCRGAFVSAAGAEPNHGAPRDVQLYLPRIDWEAGRPGKQTIRVMEFCG
jgi:hypothetical protein